MESLEPPPPPPPPLPPPPYSPYSGSGSGSAVQRSQQYRVDQANEAIKDIERHYHHDLEICSHFHELLISIAETETTNDDDGGLLSPLAVFHHWNSVHIHFQSSMSASASSSNAFPAKLGLEELKLLHGLRDLGSFQLPAINVSTSSSAAAGIHEYLTTLMDSSASSDSDNIASILSRLRSVSSSSLLQQAGFVSVHFLALEVHSNSSDALFSGGPAPAWKLFMPASPPRPPWRMEGSCWKPDLEDLLTWYPEWRRPQGGGQWRLLVQGVREERAEELRRSMVLFPASQENVIYYERERETE